MNRFFSALFLAAGLLASGMPSPADASTPPQQHALAEGKNSPVSPQQRKQAVENLEKLLGKRLFKKAAEQAVSVRGPVGGLEKLDVRDIQAIYRLGCSNLQHA